jgi:hypothetical protein
VHREHKVQIQGLKGQQVHKEPKELKEPKEIMLVL